MNVLTGEEIDVVTDKQWDGIRGREIAAADRAYARAIEAAVIRKLAAGVSVEPSAYRFTENRGNGNTEFNYYGLDEVGMAYRDNCLEITPLYTATAIAAARVAALEECAKLCEDLYETTGHDLEYGGCGVRPVRVVCEGSSGASGECRG